MYIKTLKRIIESRALPDEAEICQFDHEFYIRLHGYIIGLIVDKNDELYLFRKESWLKGTTITTAAFIKAFKLNSKKVRADIENGMLYESFRNSKKIRLKEGMEYLIDNDIDISEFLTDKISFKDLEDEMWNRIYELHKKETFESSTSNMRNFITSKTSRVDMFMSSIKPEVRTEIKTDMMAMQCRQLLTHFELETL